MANECMNTMTITGNPEELRQFREAAQSESEPMDIKRFIPIPLDIQDTEPHGPDQGYAAKMIELHGFPDWRQ